MSKKSKRAKQSGQAKQRHHTARVPSQTHEREVQPIMQAQQQMHEGDFVGCIRTCETLLQALPGRSEMRLEILGLLGLAHGMLKQYQQSYEVFSEAITLDPTIDVLWYNHGMACSYLARPAEAVHDFERAVALTKNKTSEIAHKLRTQLKVSRQELQEAMQAHEPGVTFEEYLAREERFTQAMDQARHANWPEAERLFRDLTETGSRVPSYWGNLGVCLMMQLQYDEAEEAFRHALTIEPDYTIARDNLRKLPEIRRSKGPVGLELIRPSQENEKQALILYERDAKGDVIASTTVESIGDDVKSTWKQVGKQPPRYDFFLNTYQETRFTTCPRCNIKTRPRKFSLVIHVQPRFTIIVEKICRFCYVCGLLIVHQDQLEQQLVTQFLTINPEAIGNAYQVAGTVDRAEWNKGEQDPLSFERLREYLHDFREVVTFQRVPV